jgi:pimeloyl-ACP methyl ester carboxylesterase
MSIENIISDKVKVSQGELYLEKVGDGKPLTLIHAGFSDHRDWKHQIRDFGKKYQTIVYDQRGSGNSSTIETAFSPAEDLKIVMAHLKIEKTHLVGHSIGGAIALDFALQYPEKVLSLVLVASGLNGYSWSKEYLELMQSVFEIPKPEIMTKSFLSAPFYAMAMANSNIKSEIEKIIMENFRKVLTWKTFDIRDVHWFFPEPITKLKDIKVPTFVIFGDKDSEDIKRIAHTLSAHIPNIKNAIIKDTDHLLNFEKPEEFNQLILNFLSNV